MPPQTDPCLSGVGGSSSSQQPAAAASSTGLRDTREGGERGARGGSSAGGQPEGGTVPLWKAARLPRNHGVGAVVLAAARGRAAAAARALGGGSGSATRSCVAAEGARRLSRPLACLARAAAPPGGVADLGGCPKLRGSRGQMHDRRSQSKACIIEKHAQKRAFSSLPKPASKRSLKARNLMWRMVSARAAFFRLGESLHTMEVVGVYFRRHEQF